MNACAPSQLKVLCGAIAAMAIPMASSAAMTKVDDGFSSEYIVGQGPGEAITKATIGQDAIYWVKVENIEPARTYGVRCLVTNASGETVSDEERDEATRATHGYFIAVMSSKLQILTDIPSLSMARSCLAAR